MKAWKLDSRSDKHINSSLDAVERILFTTAKHCLKIKNIKKRYTRLSSVSSNKKWCDKECSLKRHELRKLAYLKHRDPLNITFREKYYVHCLKTVQIRSETEDKRLLLHQDFGTGKHGRQLKQPKFLALIIKSMDDSMKETSTPPISEESWLSHLQSLHSNEPP